MLSEFRCLPVSVIILTYNEELNIEACLRSLVGWVDEIFVVDSGSTDRTLEIAQRYGAVIYQHDYEGPRQQWEWALKNVPLKHSWFLMMDADLRISPELKRSISLALSNPQYDGYYLGRMQVFRGQPLRHGGLYPRYQLRLVHLEKAYLSINDTLIDEQLYVDGKTTTLKGDLIEENLKESGVIFYLAKHLRYAELQAEQELIWRTRQPKPVLSPVSIIKNRAQRKLWLKDCWYRLPLYYRPIVYFVYRYFLRLGFLDGKQGFVYHFLQAWWYRFIVDIKLEELLQSSHERDKKARGYNEIAF